MNLGKRLKFFREQAKLNQKEAAELIGVKSYQLANYETNRSEPNINTLKKMSKVYQVSIDGLVDNMFVNKDGLPSNQDIEMNELLKRLNQLVEEYKDNNSND